MNNPNQQKGITIKEIKEALQPKTKRIGIVCLSVIVCVCVVVDFKSTETVIALVLGGVLGLLDPK